MKRIPIFSIALLASATSIIALLGASAYAADLPQRPVYKQPAPMIVAPVYNWTGCYVGGNLGAAWGRAEFSDTYNGTASGTNSGFAGGLQIGCDYQIGQFVIGARNLFDWTDLNSGVAFGSGSLAGYTGNSKTTWFDTLTARGGFLLQPNILLYVQGGAAWMQSSQYVNNPLGVQVGQISNNKTGWTIGGGAEWMFVPQWSVFLEYNYMDFGSSSGTVAVGATAYSVNVKNDAQNVLVGLNYKF
jgi:outer membrane immunogenic protein